ncbi:MAG: cyclodeaminase/cyclohydrolase family protein [Spirochaetaceae bacterium]|jgi:formiminotetrahydrofolate cyclodeaminase|nr:cyclodeaminase/cyclohydrolase family protein [Spirochaetaceae bacterium]
MDFTKQSCEEFVKALASKEPVPGGGGASALVGALGIALGNMVGNLTAGKKKYAAVEEDMRILMEKAGTLQRELLALVNRDAEAFEPLARAYGLPQETEEEKAQKLRIMEAALEGASAAPLEIMEKCGEAILLCGEFAAKGAAIALSDAGVGAVFCKAALLGASLNVFINTKAMSCRSRAEGINKKARELLNTYIPLADDIYAGLIARFN